jgi:hypothetical protein
MQKQVTGRFVVIDAVMLQRLSIVNSFGTRPNVVTGLFRSARRLAGQTCGGGIHVDRAVDRSLRDYSAPTDERYRPLWKAVAGRES